MRRLLRQMSILACAAIGSFAVLAGAQSSGGPYRIERSVVAAGGGQTSGGAFALRSTLGQALTTRSTGGTLELQAGYWPAAVAIGDPIFANGFEP